MPACAQMKKLMTANGCMFVCGWVLPAKPTVSGACATRVLPGAAYSLGPVPVPA